MFVLVVVYFLPFKEIKDGVAADDEFGRVIFAAWDIVGCSCAAPGIQPCRNTRI